MISTLSRTGSQYYHITVITYIVSDFFLFEASKISKDKSLFLGGRGHPVYMTRVELIIIFIFYILYSILHMDLRDRVRHTCNISSDAQILTLQAHELL